MEQTKPPKASVGLDFWGVVGSFGVGEDGETANPRERQKCLLPYGILT